MHTAERPVGTILTADEFLITDQRAFGDAWRYELVDGAIIPHTAPSPDHGAILASLVIAVGNRLRLRRDTCRVETGSGAAPKRQQHNTARIPDAMIRCGAGRVMTRGGIAGGLNHTLKQEHRAGWPSQRQIIPLEPRVVFEIVSPSELRAWRARNQKRRDEQDVESVQEIVELYQGEASAHIYRRERDDRWSFNAIDGLEAMLRLESVDLDIPLREIYETVELPGPDEGKPPPS